MAGTDVVSDVVQILNIYVRCPVTSFYVVANTDVKKDAIKDIAFPVTMQGLMN